MHENLGSFYLVLAAAKRMGVGTAFLRIAAAACCSSRTWIFPPWSVRWKQAAWSKRSR